jgi:hypothetical protein
MSMMTCLTSPSPTALAEVARTSSDIMYLDIIADELKESKVSF